METDETIVDLNTLFEHQGHRKIYNGETGELALRVGFVHFGIRFGKDEYTERFGRRVSHRKNKLPVLKPIKFAEVIQFFSLNRVDLSWLDKYTYDHTTDGGYPIFCSDAYLVENAK